MCVCEHTHVSRVTETVRDAGGAESPFKVCESIRLTSPLGGGVPIGAEAYGSVSLKIPIPAIADDEDDEDEVYDFDPEPGSMLFHKRTGARIRIINRDNVPVIVAYSWGGEAYRKIDESVYIVEHESKAYYLNHYASDQVAALTARELMDYRPVQIGDDH